MIIKLTYTSGFRGSIWLRYTGISIKKTNKKKTNKKKSIKISIRTKSKRNIFYYYKKNNMEF